MAFQSTHPARGATAQDYRAFVAEFLISIHAPREGCDQPGRSIRIRDRDFNPRTPRGVRTLMLLPPADGIGRFQSTHPARGATYAALRQAEEVGISIHAPREGCDSKLYQRAESLLGSIAYLHKGKKAEHTKTNAPMLHEAFLYAFWVRTGRRRRVLLDFARYKIKGSSGR